MYYEKEAQSITICNANNVGTIRGRKPFRVSLDSGSIGCWTKRSALPQAIVPKVLSNDKQSNTLAGKLSANEMVVLRNLRLPEFDQNIEKQMHNVL